MPLYECNEHQFVENIRRLLESKERFLVNRKMMLHDDAKYGPATMPDHEFKRYEMICTRKSINSTVYAKVPFIDNFHHNRMYEEGENLHSASTLPVSKDVSSILQSRILGQCMGRDLLFRI